MAKILAAIIALLAVSFLQQSPTFAARSAPGKTIYSTSDTYSFTLNAGELFYSGTGPHISGPLYGVKFGYDAPGNSVLDSFGTEGSLYYFSSNSDGEQGDTTGYLFRIEEVLPFTPGERLVPFAAVGAGGIYTSDDKVSKALPFLNYGVGLKYFLTSAVALRADFRHILAFTLGGTDNFEVSTGISYYFGKKSPKKTEPTPEAKKSEDAQKSNGKSRKNEKDQKKEEQLAQEKKEKERVAQELRDQERRKEEKLRKERLQKEWEEFEAQKQGKTAVAASPKTAPAKTEQIAETTIQPEQALIAVAPEAAAPAGVPGAPLPVVVPGVAVGSTMAAALPPAAAEIAAEPAQTEVIVKSLPAEKTAATPPAAPLQATQPAALPAETALADQKIEVPARETVAKTTIQPEQAPIAVAPEAAAPAGVPGAPLPVVVPGVAVGSTMAAALPSAAAAQTPAQETGTTAITMDTSSAKIATSPALTGTGVKPLPAADTDVTPPAPSIQATPPATAPAATALVGQEVKIPTGKAGLSRTERGRENVVRELQINFDFDKSAVKKIYLSHIKQIAFLLKSNPGFSVIIEGHTDNIGSSKYNLNLSQRRAKSVKNDLVQQGVADKRIFTKGYGLTRPIASNLTVKGRQKNRRAVTIIIVTNNSIPKSR